MTSKKNAFEDENQASYLSEGEGEECPLCHQEYQGACPINSAECPFREDAEDEVEDEDEDEDDADFEDVAHLREVVQDDEEADRLTDEEDEDKR
jgi:hypothetical protein